MLSLAAVFLPSISTRSLPFKLKFKFKTRAILKPLNSSYSNNLSSQNSSAVENSIRVLEWDKLCECVSSYAGTSLGRQATKEQLRIINWSYEESKNLLAETNAAVEMLKFGGSSGMDFSGLDVVLVKSAIRRASRSMPVDGKEALAVAFLLQISNSLQLNVKAALKEDADWYNRFMPLTELITNLFVNQTLAMSILQVIEDDGYVKDSASSDLSRSRDRVRMLEKKLFQLMDSLIRKETNETSSLEVSSVGGRWCIESGFNQLTTVNGLLLSSGSGAGSLVEPLSAVPINDELQEARALAAKAEEDVLMMLTEKIQTALDGIRDLLNTIIQLDAVTARAKYSLSFGGTCPDLFSTEEKDESDFSSKNTVEAASSHPTQRKWILYLPKAYHPLLLQQHQKNLQKARKNLTNAIVEIRRRKLQSENATLKENPDIKSLEMQVTKLEEAHPVPVDFFVGKETRVLIITGPNTGGKTICLKTIGLAAMMAKSGLYVLSSEPVRIPWFDSIFADIGDEQSLSQSLSTFSGHLRQISCRHCEFSSCFDIIWKNIDRSQIHPYTEKFSFTEVEAIQAQSTSRSLVLLDEVGAGTNPLEGAALGMSILESFAEAGSLLTVATTHHGELKTLKYSNDAFENACMEFDEEKLKPTYKILWGIPGRSNAINIAERLRLPDTVVGSARELYGTASAEIDGVILDMERFKQDFQKHVHDAQHHLNLAREQHKNLLVAKQKITEHGITQRYRMMRNLSEVAATARSNLHKILRQHRTSAAQLSMRTTVNNQQITLDQKKGDTADDNQKPLADKAADTVEHLKQSPSEKQISVPKVGDLVHVSSLGQPATVLKIDSSKGVVFVQVNNMKLRLKLTDLRS